MASWIRSGRLELRRSLAADPELQARAAALRRVDAALDAAFDPILDAPLPALHLTTGHPAPASVVRQLDPRPAARLGWARVRRPDRRLRGRPARPDLSIEAPIAVAAIQAKLPRRARERGERHDRGVQRPRSGHLGHRQAAQHLPQRRRQLLPRLRGARLTRGGQPDQPRRRLPRRGRATG